MIHISIIRSVVVKIGADISSLQKSMKEAQSVMQDMGSKLQGVGKKLSLALTLPIVGIGRSALKAGMDFEEGMSKIKALGGATGNEMQKLHDLAILMGAETKYSAVEAAQGIEEMMKAGVSTEQILNGGLKGALALASAGELDLAEAAEIASTALNAFKGDNLTVSKAADILAGAANASATDVRELKFALSSVSAVASSVGMTFEDTATALAAFAQNGLKGSDAGTSLKTMLLNLQPSTKTAIAQFKKLNLLNVKGQSIFFNSAGKLKSMADIAGILKNRMKGLTDAQRLAAMETMFGTDAIRAANILYKEGTDGITNMKTEMSKVTAEEVAKEKMDNLKGSMEQLKGSLETLAVKLFEMDSGPLKSLVDGLTNLVNGFMGLDSNVQQQVVIFGGLLAAIGPISWVVGGITSAVGVLSGAVSSVIGVIGVAIEAFALWAGGAGTLGEVLALLPGGPVAWVIGAIVALGAAIAILWNTNEGFKNALINAWNAIKAASITVFEWMKPYIMAIFNDLKAFWIRWGPTITQMFKDLLEIWKIYFLAVFKEISTIAQLVFTDLEIFWQAWGPLITTIFDGTFKNILNILKTVFGLIKNTIITSLQIVSNLIGAFLDILKGDWSGAWEHIKNATKAWFDGIQNVVDISLSHLKDSFNIWKSAVLTKEVWEQVQVEMQKRAEAKGNFKGSDKYQNRYPLTGMLFCSICGAVLRRRTWNSKHSCKKIVWQCGNYIENGKDACPGTRIDDEVIGRLNIKEPTVVKEVIKNGKKHYSYTSKSKPDKSSTEHRTPEKENGSILQGFDRSIRAVVKL